MLPTENESKIIDNIQGQFDRLYAIAVSTKNDTQNIMEFLESKFSNAIISIPADNNGFLSEHLSDITEMRKNGKVSAALALMIKFKERNWSTIDEELKFKVIINLAGIYLELSQQKEAGQTLLELEDISFEGQERAINLCLAYCLTDNRIKFEKISKEYDLEKTTNESFWTSYVILNRSIIKIEQMMEILPKEMLESAQVLINLSGIFFENRDNAKGFEFLELAMKQLPSNLKDRWLLQNWAYNRALSAIAIREKVHLRSFTTIDKGYLERCCEAFTEIWEYIANTDLRSHVSSIVYNRGMVHKYLGRDNQALKDLEEAWEIDKSFRFFQGLVFHLHDMGEKEKVTSLYGQRDLIVFEDSDEELEFDTMSSLHYSKLGNITESINCLTKWLKSTKGEDKLKILNLICINYLDNSAFEEVKEYILLCLQEFPEFPDGYYHLCLFLKESKDKNGAEQAILNAYEIAIKTDCDKYNVMVPIGIELMDIERFNEAAACFKKVYTYGNHDEIGINLLKCYYLSGQYEEALDMYNSLGQNGKDDPKVNDHIFRIYENKGELWKAKELLSYNLKIQKGNAKDHFIILAIHFYKLTGNSTDLKDILEYLEVTHFFDMEERFHIAGLMLDYGFTQQGMQLAYDTRLLYFQQKKAHEYFIPLIVVQGNRSALGANIFPIDVQMECGIYLNNVNGIESYFFLTDNPQISGANIVRSNEPLASKLIGKILDDDISFPNSIGENSLQKVVSIIDRYTHAVRESMKILETKYPDQTSFKVIRTNDNDSKNFKDHMQDQLVEVNRVNLNLFNLYKNNICTLGTIQVFLGLSYIETWLKLIGNPHTPFYCLNQQALEYTPCFLDNSENKIVLELSSLLTLGCVLDKLKWLNELISSEIYVTVGSLLELREFHRIMTIDRPDARIGLKNGKVVKHIEREVDFEFLKKSIEKIIEWCEKNAKILSPRVYDNQTKHLCKIIGKTSMDCILLAKELGAHLMSDDERLKGFALGQFHINSFGSYTLIRTLCGEKIIDIQSYNDAKLKLIRYNYIYIPIDHKLLWQLFEESKFKLEAPFTNAVHGLNCLKANELSTEIVHFAKMLYLNLAINESIEIVLTGVITQLYGRKDLPELKSKIKISIQKNFRLIPMQAKHINEFIEMMI
ncbi:tetratricopeptide repeat protein [Sphingobacterium sp. HSC-15S19]|uniref:tetratricopeptide repeat protein n=1 Tax=Sphingobacterium TaxID=28453 RepID=UPI003D2528C2